MIAGRHQPFLAADQLGIGACCARNPPLSCITTPPMGCVVLRESTRNLQKLFWALAAAACKDMSSACLLLCCSLAHLHDAVLPLAW